MFTKSVRCCLLFRGLASTVRKCIDKVTGTMFAVKIVDVSTEQQSLKEAMKLREETKSEVELLRELRGHPAISTIPFSAFDGIVN